MKKRVYTSEYKVKLILEILREDQTIGEIAAKYEINPNQLSNWRRDFLDKIPGVFDESKKERDIRRAEKEAAEKEAAEKEAAMLRTIGQLTIERDYLQTALEKVDGKKVLL